MTKQELLDKLKPLALDKNAEGHFRDTEADHMEADDLLIAYINDPDIKAAYEAIAKWYA